MKNRYRNNPTKHKVKRPRRQRVSAKEMRGYVAMHGHTHGVYNRRPQDVDMCTYKLLRKFHMTHPSELTTPPRNRKQRRLRWKQIKSLFGHIASGHTIPVHIFNIRK